jgi:hypothetical protein
MCRLVRVRQCCAVHIQSSSQGSALLIQDFWLPVLWIIVVIRAALLQPCRELNGICWCRWLDGACDARSIEEAHPEYSAAKVAQLIDIAKEARLCLQKDEKQREKFWEVLLSEAGLCSYVRSPQPK